MHMQMVEFYATIFAWLLCLSDRPPALWGLSPSGVWDAVYDAVGVNCKNGAAAKNYGTGA